MEVGARNFIITHVDVEGEFMKEDAEYSEEDQVRLFFVNIFAHILRFVKNLLIRIK